MKYPYVIRFNTQSSAAMMFPVDRNNIEAAVGEDRSEWRKVVCYFLITKFLGGLATGNAGYGHDRGR